MNDLSKSVQYIKGVGPTKVKLLERLGVKTLEDLITYFPRDYEDRSRPRKIEDLEDGEYGLIKAIVMSRASSVRIRGGRSMQKIMVSDETGTCQITWFNQPYLRDKFVLGKEYFFYGKAQVRLGRIDMTSPVYDEGDSKKNTGRIIPLYPSTYGLSQNSIRAIIENGLKDAGELEETLPKKILDAKKLVEINEAIHQIHFPEDFSRFKEARNRLAFEELFSMQLALLSLKNEYHKDEKGIAFSKDAKMSDVIFDLPFKLTKAQLRVLEEIDKDMEQEKPMNRLLQGDVGSRKNYSKLNCCI